MHAGSPVADKSSRAAWSRQALFGRFPRLPMSRAVRSYYRTIDEKRYGDLWDLLAPDFVHERPDRTIEGRDSFVAFMRDDRPRTETSHELDRLYDAGDEIAVRGRLLDGGERLFGFVDVHTVENGEIARIGTYTD